MTTFTQMVDAVQSQMAFDEWWESDAAFEVRHADERTIAKAAWLAAYRIGYDRGYEVMRENCDEIRDSEARDADR